MRYTIEIVPSIDDIDHAALDACVEDSFESFKRNVPWENTAQAYCDRNGITLASFEENGDIENGRSLDQYLKACFKGTITQYMTRTGTNTDYNSYHYVSCIKDTENSNKIMAYTSYIKPNGDPGALRLTTSAMRNGSNGLKTWLYTFWADCGNNYSQSLIGQLNLDRQEAYVTGQELANFYLNSGLGFELKEGSTLPEADTKQGAWITGSCWRRN